jgi:phospholipid/cholesterol/gamma-HCH transport system substrate-binding protein
METRTHDWRKLILPGAFALACTVLTLLTLRAFGGALPLEPHGYRVEIPLKQAPDLVRGSDVQIAGVHVGDVVDVRRARTGATATLELKDQYAPIRSGARAIVRTKTLLGEGYVEIAPGPRSAAPVREDGSLAPSQVKPSVPLDEMLQTFGPGTRRRMRQLFAGLATAFDGRAQGFNDALGDAEPLTDNLATVFQALRGQQADLQRVLAGSGEVFNALGARQGSLKAAIAAGDDLLSVTARRDRELGATIRALPSFLRQLKATSDTVASASGDLNGAVAAVRPVAPLVRPALSSIDTNAPEFRRLFRALPATIRAGNLGLPAATRILRSTPGALRELYPTTRQVIPLMQLFATLRNVVAGAIANSSSVQNAVAVGPQGRIISGAGGAVTIWNETIAGWKKRLPTNRGNPYPSPSFLVKFPQTHVLETFDCRHLNNPLYVPPTGSGVPPCLQQQPWEFNGVTRSYPHLEEAPP